MKRIVVVGGGLSGLATARALTARRELAERGVEILVLEDQARPGGKARTARDDGWLVERGPNGFLDSVPRTLELAREVGLGDRILPARDAAASRFLWLRGALRPIPMSPPAFFRSDLLSLRGRLRILGEPLARRRPDGDETVAAFARRRIGAEAARSLVAPMVLGVFAGDAERLSLRSVFPKMWEMETEHGSLVRAMLARARRRGRGGPGGPAGPGGHLTSFPGGVEEFAGALAGSLGGAVRCGRRVAGLRKDGQGWKVSVEGEGEGIPASVVILACEAFASAGLLEAHDGELAAELRGIPYAPVLVLGLGYDASAFPRPPDGFGFLAPRREGLRILGCLWDSSIFPGRAPGGKVLLRAMLGGAVDPEAAALDDDELIRVVRRDLESSMGIVQEPERVVLSRWERGIPQYLVGHAERLDRVEERLGRLPGLYLTGNGYRGVALNACVTEADRIADRVVADLDRTTSSCPI
jgi:oxygen-dependent protoporphyrinogen oxidase